MCPSVWEYNSCVIANWTNVLNDVIVLSVCYFVTVVVEQAEQYLHHVIARNEAIST